MSNLKDLVPPIELCKLIPALVHELQHATQYALYERCDVDRREAELPAYYMEFLSREFLYKYKEIGNDNEN